MLSSPHVRRGCSRTCGVSSGRCCRGYRSGGAAFEQLRRSSDRPEHAPLRLSSPHFFAWLLACWRHQLRPLLRRKPLRRRCFRAALGVHPIALSTHRFGVAVFARRGCLLACGISFGRCCLDGRSGGAASAAMAFIRSPNARIASASAVLICSVAAFVLVASALTAVALIGRSGGADFQQHRAFTRSS